MHDVPHQSLKTISCPEIRPICARRGRPLVEKGDHYSVQGEGVLLVHFFALLDAPLLRLLVIRNACFSTYSICRAFYTLCNPGEGAVGCPGKHRRGFDWGGNVKSDMGKYIMLRWKYIACSYRRVRLSFQLMVLLMKSRGLI